MKLRTLNYSIGLLVILMAGCSQKKTASLFVPLTHEQTGIHFSNKVQPTPSFNLFSYMYFYNGAGVGAGDFNNDGLIDLFFASNQQPNALYLNTGKLNFKDATTEAKIPADGNWSTGVSVVDINNDGLLDIYVCNVGNYKTLKGKNQLLVCQGITNGVPVYADKAADYGLDFSGFSTQAAFLDYDADGDLDMFLLNHSVNHDGNYAPRGLFEHTYDSLAGQRLYRNNQQIGKDGKKRIGFSNVTKDAGINGSKIGYGLGVTVADINLDGWPDIYVGNDFHENDYLYINQQNGTFAEQGSKQLMHTSQFSMGVDVADVNNDAYPEIISMDMLPYDPYMLKRSLAEDDYNIFQQKLQYGYTYQYARNNLQYNRKNGMFSEVGQYAGVHATDWSWASLWMDFDNDGLKDLFVSNGIPKRMNDIDYVNYVSGDELQQKLKQNTIQDKDLSLISKFPEIKIPNQFFRNTGNLKFQNLTDSIQNNLPTFSNGSVYADLDNDGDLDLVVNNINDPVLVYENKTNATGQEKNFVKVELKGDSNNVNALGAKLLVYAKDQLYTYEQYPVHGFQSSMLLPLQAGLKNIQVDSALVIWPDRTWQPVQLLNENLVKLSYKKGLPLFDFAQRFAKSVDTKQSLLEDITSTTGINYKHQENVFNEFDREPLIPHMVSTEGPALAVADINGDGLEDVFIGASKGNKNAVYTQTASGNFTRMNQPALAADSMWEDVDAIWVDVNNDKAIDLVIATGGNEYYENDEHLRPLLYLNDGRGNLRKKQNAFTEIVNTQSKVIANDINGDGFVDLFFAGRSVPWAYGMTPRSYLMLNDGYGNFRDITQAYAPALVQPGLITDAQWVDMDKDQQKDLLIAYQWGGIELFLKKQNGFERKMITTKKGWWQSIYADDIDQDGDIDLIAGNFGLNSRITASEKYPVRMYMNDFDDNGRVEQIMTYFVNGTEMPLSSKLQLEKSIPVLRKKYLYAADFAKADLKQLFAPQKFEKAYQLETNCFEHILLLNEGELKFSAQALPQETQFSQLRSVIKVENNGSPYWLTMGNYYENNVEIGRQDADFSTLLQYVKGKGLVASNVKSALITGQVRKAKPILIRNSKAYILARNNDAVVVLQNRSTEKQGN